MKKSQKIILSSVLLAAIASCNDAPKDEWTDGRGTNGNVHDTSIYRNGGYHYYRYYGGGWYMLHRNNQINVNEMAPATAGEIGSASFAPRAASGGIRAGGFGSSAHGGAGE